MGIVDRENTSAERIWETKKAIDNKFRARARILEHMGAQTGLSKGLVVHLFQGRPQYMDIQLGHFKIF